MNDTTILFEDEGFRSFLPLVHSRPVFELRCGIYTARERAEAILGRSVGGLCRTHLANVYGAGRWSLGLITESAPVLLINGRALDMPWLDALQQEPINTIYVADAGPGILQGQVLLGARISPALASAILYYLMNQQGDLALAELRRFARVVECDARLLNFPWDLITSNGEQIARDVPIYCAQTGVVSVAERPLQDPHIVVRNPEQVFVHPNAKLDSPMVLDGRDGPVVIAATHIEPFTFVQGPAAIGSGGVLSRARILGETTIGPVCRIGGEVEASIVQAYTNKHHDGFLGHAYLGEWVNIGAMTTNSDLKNTYGTIRMQIEGLGQIDSGVMKLGCFLADHVKLGIGVHLNGGAVIGTGSNIFGVHSAPKTIPPFTWGGEVFREYRIDAMIDVARKVMSRRKIELTQHQEGMLREVFAQTRGSRNYSDSDLSTEAKPKVSTNEEALARAEAEAILAASPRSS
jgi:UDP-N-acetylglucosamine diphosphorylase/glucosamine-1-phosphate N-acetyltransferase